MFIWKTNTKLPPILRNDRQKYWLISITNVNLNVLKDEMNRSMMYFFIMNAIQKAINKGLFLTRGTFNFLNHQKLSRCLTNINYWWFIWTEGLRSSMLMEQWLVGKFTLSQSCFHGVLWNVNCFKNCIVKVMKKE